MHILTRVSAPPEAVLETTGRRPTPRGVVLLQRNRAALVSLVFLVLVGAGAVFAPWITPHDPTATESSQSLKPGFWAGNVTHFLGTDLQGRDILSRLLYSARISVAVGLSAVVISVLLGVS